MRTLTSLETKFFFHITERPTSFNNFKTKNAKHNVSGGASRLFHQFLSSTPSKLKTFLLSFFSFFFFLGGCSRPNLDYASFNFISILDSHIFILLKEITALFIWNSNMPTYFKLILLCTLG